MIAQNEKNYVLTTFLVSSFGPTAEYTSCPDLFCARIPQKHNVRPTVAALQLRIGRTRHALTRTLTARHAIARVTTTAPHNEPHINMHTIDHTHA